MHTESQKKMRLTFCFHLSYVLQRQLIKGTEKENGDVKKKAGPVLKKHPGPSEISRRLFPTHGDGPFIKETKSNMQLFDTIAHCSLSG
ncbi:hypothetical protein GHT06_012989 [Daphnia sinensis]|uniref:Uncharacterized protein n=1 Tax=Daphnia sinensis TaxID=1820382 RepID=A0AAD5KWK5_9CRUS|nr:hypothetical protein GHT06_012989 [Daphnia sinensis]